MRFTLRVLHWRGRLRQVFLEQRLKQDHRQEGDEKNQQQPPFAAGFVLRILVVSQSIDSLQSVMTDRLLSDVGFCVPCHRIVSALHKRMAA